MRYILENEQPFKEPYRRIPPALIQEVREHLKEMLEAGSAYAIPRFEDTLYQLAGAKYFTKLNLKSGYWQLELKEDKPKIAFQVGSLGFYECNRMPFGL